MVSTEFEESVSISDGARTWTKAAEYVGTHTTAGENIEVWTTRADEAGSHISLTSTMTGPPLWKQSLTVIVFRGAAGIGNVTEGCYSGTNCTSRSRVPTIALTPFQSGSMVFGVGYDYSDQVTKTVPRGEAIDQQAFDTTELATMWVQNANSRTIGGSPVTLTASTSGNDNWALVAFEVVPTEGKAASPPTSMAPSQPSTVSPTTAPPPTTVPPTSPPTTATPTTTPPPPPTTAPLPATLLSQAGSGTADTQQFTVSQSSWQLLWTYDCANFGTQGNFIVNVNGYGAAASTTDQGVNQLGRSSTGDEHYYDSGTFNLSVSSECDWTVKVIQP